MKRINHIIGNINKLTFTELFLEIEKLALQNSAAYIIKPTRDNGFKEKIYRARPIIDKQYNHIDELTYNPWPKKIDRASTPCSPMFYGAISANSIDIPILTNFVEINEVLRKKSSNYNEQEIAIAEYELKEDILTAAIIFHTEFLKKNIQYQDLYNKTKQSSPYDFEILEDFSKLFSLTEHDDSFDNRLTAVFTHFLLSKNNNIDAVLYPSVRAEGEGTNIAIHPASVNNKLICTKVRVVKLYTQDKFVVYDNIKRTDTINEDGSFNLNEITDSELHLGNDKCREILSNTIENYYRSKKK